MFIFFDLLRCTLPFKAHTHILTLACVQQRRHTRSASVASTHCSAHTSLIGGTARSTHTHHIGDQCISITVFFFVPPSSLYHCVSFSTTVFLSPSSLYHCVVAVVRFPSSLYHCDSLSLLSLCMLLTTKSKPRLTMASRMWSYDSSKDISPGTFSKWYCNGPAHTHTHTHRMKLILRMYHWRLVPKLINTPPGLRIL